MPKVKIVIHDVAIAKRVVMVADRCPECSGDLTVDNAVSESQLCQMNATSHFDTANKDDALAPDSPSEEPDFAATLVVNCASCGYELARGDYQEA